MGQYHGPPKKGLKGQAINELAPGIKIPLHATGLCTLLKKIFCSFLMLSSIDYIICVPYRSLWHSYIFKTKINNLLQLALSHYIYYICQFPVVLYNLASLCLEVNFFISFYYKIFHFLYYFNIVEVFRFVFLH